RRSAEAGRVGEDAHGRGAATDVGLRHARPLARAPLADHACAGAPELHLGDGAERPALAAPEGGDGARSTLGIEGQRGSELGEGFGPTEAPRDLAALPGEDAIEVVAAAHRPWLAWMKRSRSPEAAPESM